MSKTDKRKSELFYTQPEDRDTKITVAHRSFRYTDTHL